MLTAIARALRLRATEEGVALPAFRAVTATTGQGVAGELDGQQYRIGRPAFAAGLAGTPVPEVLQQAEQGGGTVIALASSAGWLGGFVLSDGVFLTALELKQMRTMPELVFLNGCHVGRAAPGGDDSPSENMVLALLKAGVQAVVAPGWVVDDDGAAEFSETFFAALSEGQRFEDAVAAARQATFRTAPQATTWAAYQAWGDPDYRLLPPPASEAA